MMEYIETEGKRFNKNLFHKSQSLQTSKKALFEKLDGFVLDKYKILFLNSLRNELFTSKIDHERTCQTKEGCGTSSLYNNAIFTVDQTIESLDENYSTINSQDSFSLQEQSEMSNKINELLLKLKKLEFGQEIIFDEIKEMKFSFNLGKKKWHQLLTGKILELGISYGIEKTLLDSIYSELTNNFKKLSSDIVGEFFK